MAHPTTPAQPGPLVKQATGRPKLWRSIGEAAEEARQLTELRHLYPELAGLKTGIACLDRHLGGMLEPGRLVVVAAETGGGKSALVNQLAEHFAQQDRVLSLILENTDIDSAYRIAANASRTDLGKMRRGWAGEQGIPAAFYKAIEHMKTLQLDTVDRAALTVEQVCHLLIDWKMDRQVEKGVLIVDQLSHLMPSVEKWWDDLAARGATTSIPRPPRPTANETVWLKWQTHVLKLLAEQTGTLIILVHQLNENHGDGKPGLSSMSGSRGINQEADLILLPWRPKVAPVEDNPFPVAGGVPTAKIREEDGDAFIICPKSRHGVEFEAEVRWVGAQQRFADRDADIKAKLRLVEPATAKQVEGGAKVNALLAQFEAARKARLSGHDPHAPVALDQPAGTRPAAVTASPAPGAGATVTTGGVRVSTTPAAAAQAQQEAPVSASADDELLWDFDEDVTVTSPTSDPASAQASAQASVQASEHAPFGAPSEAAAAPVETVETAVAVVAPELVDVFAGLPAVRVLTDEEYAEATAEEDRAREARRAAKANAAAAAAAAPAPAPQVGGGFGGFGGGGRSVVRPDIF